MRILLVIALLLCSVVQAAERWEYRVLDRKPHSREYFTQGLEIHDGIVIEGTGNYGRSRLLRYRLDSGEVLAEQALPEQLFGEGITRLGERIYQLTWREGVGLIWNAETLEPLGEFSLKGEGWGLCNDGQSLILSDGSATLRWLNPEDFSELRWLTVTLNGQPLPRLNELEWVDGRLLANVWLSDVIVVINPDSGIIEGMLDLGGLLPERERRPDTDVLNGMAWDSDSETLWVTGKHWPWLYQLRVPQLRKPSTEALQ